MAKERLHRRLAAILAADVVGYSRLMERDEARAHATLKTVRTEVLEPITAQFGGRIFKGTGDGVLVEYPSAVDAVLSAVGMQRALSTWNRDRPAEWRIEARIGINLGDVIVEDDDLYGDGVNVATRLESLAEPGGICIASIVNECVGSRVDVAFGSGGEVTVKNIERPIRVWKWHPDSDPVAELPRRQKGDPVEVRREQSSIAVLPFDNMSGDPEQEYFSDGISDDIITDLSKIAGLMVIARNSSFAYKGKTVDIRTIARDLGVKSILEGSIRRAGNRVRITAQLIDAATGAHLWAERYDRDLTDLFDVQDDVTHRIVEALKVTLTPAEAERLADGTTRNVEAHDLFLRAREMLNDARKDAPWFRQCTALLKGAIALDPGYGDAYAGLAMAYNLDFHNRWTDDPDRSLKIAMRHSGLAIEKAPNEPFGHFVASIVAGYLKDIERAEAEIEIALELSPNFAPAVNARGVGMIYDGRPESAIPYIERAMRLDPALNQQYLHFLGMAHLITGKCETAAAELRQRILLAPETDFSRAYLASALGHLGEFAEARTIWNELIRVNPNYSFDAHMSRLPFRGQAEINTIRDGLTKAGLLN